MKNKAREVKVGPYCERPGRSSFYCTASGELPEQGALRLRTLATVGKIRWNWKKPEQDQQKANAIGYKGCIIACEGLGQEGKGGHSLVKASKTESLATVGC